MLICTKRFDIKANSYKIKKTLFNLKLHIENNITETDTLQHLD
jgi:hypothetical protein